MTDDRTGTGTGTRTGTRTRWLLRPPAACWQPVLRPGPGLTATDLERLRAVGLVVAVAGGVHLLADVADDPAHRARALAPLLPAHSVAALGAAAWVHGAGPAADPVDVLVRLGVGPSVHPTDGVRVHCARLAPGDVVHVAGVPVTSRVRTAADLARAADPTAVALLARMLAAGVATQEVLAALVATRHAGRGRRALAAATADAQVGADPAGGSSPARFPVIR